MKALIEENYLKAIYKLALDKSKPVSTSDLAQALTVQAATVTDMLKKLAAKKLISYEKYKGVELTKAGRAAAVKVVRKHRLWEAFLVEKLNFSWSEVHEVAEQLEHVHSQQLTDRLDKFLGFPEIDPHGDPIPDRKGKVRKRATIPLSALKPGEEGVIAGVKHDGKDLLNFLESQGLVLENSVVVTDVIDFDRSMKIKVDGALQMVSEKVAKNVLVMKGS
jgi:DtxR family Mn-dependent transcriptional regulator